MPQSPIICVPYDRNPRQLIGWILGLYGRSAARPVHRSQFTVLGTSPAGGHSVTPRAKPPALQECTSVTSPIPPPQMISQATRVASAEYPWFPIWVATLYR